MYKYEDIVDITQDEIDATFEFVELISSYEESRLYNERLLSFILPHEYHVSHAIRKSSIRVFERIPFSISVNMFTGLLRSKLDDRYIRPQLTTIFVSEFPKEQQKYLLKDNFEYSLYDIAKEMINKRNTKS